MARKGGVPGLITPDALYDYTKHAQQDASCGCSPEAVMNPNCSCRGDSDVHCKPIECTYDRDFDENAHKYRICCDANGCCCKYPCSCRNPFWPEFAHPRWLCCRDLYNGEAESCYGNE